MAIVITPAETPATVNQVITLIYGLPGVGKTTLACTSDQPMLLDFDGGMHRSLLRCDRVEVNEWNDVASLNAYDLSNHSTVIVDTFGEALKVLGQHINKHDRSTVQRNGEMTMQGWGTLRRQFVAWLKRLTDMEKDVVILAHSEEFGRGEETVERPMSQGRTRNDIYQKCDCIGLLTIVAGEIRLNFSPSDLSLGKNAGNLPVMTVPNPEVNPNFMGNIIRQMKANMNSRSAVNAAGDHLKQLSKRLNDIAGIEGFQAEVQRMRAEKSPNQEKKLLINVAKEKGFILDRTQGIFVVDPEYAHAGTQNGHVPAESTTTPAAEPATTPAAEPATTPAAEPAATPAAEPAREPEPVAAAVASNAAATTTAAATAVQDPASGNPDGEFAPPPDMANHVNEPPPPINDPFNNPKGDDEEGDFDF